MNMQKKAAKTVSSGTESVFPEKKKDTAKTPYLSRGIYNNYTKGMKEKNRKRVQQGLEAIHVRTFEEWCGE